jgi:hypothetical protein
VWYKTLSLFIVAVTLVAISHDLALFDYLFRDQSKPAQTKPTEQRTTIGNNDKFGD